ncbi:MAG: YraN family protein [Firmicutes bacterium]|nr:YraN family protein [Bacillota bacterium]
MNKGRLWEEKVCLYLQQQGLDLLEQNWRTRYGEIDLIMKDKEVVVFVEVKYRANTNFGSPFEALDCKKIATIRKVAQQYITQKKIANEVRFDVVGITGRDIEWLKGVF